MWKLKQRVMMHNIRTCYLAVIALACSVIYAQGNVLTTTDPTSKVWTYTYNAKSQLLTTKDPGNKVVLTLEYAGNLPAPTRVTRPLYAPTTKINYTATGEVDTTQIDFGGGVIETTADYTYDAYKNVVQVTDQTGANVYATYDTMGRPLTVTDATGAVTTPTYDGWGRAIGATLPGGATVSVNLNVIGQVTSATDQLGRTGTVSYNDAGFVTSATNAKNETTTYAYNNNGWTTSVTNARGFARTFTYAPRGEVYSLTQPDGALETWSYNQNGDVSIYTNALSQQINYAYDDAGRQTLVDYPTGGDTSFGYDSLGRNTSMTDSVGVSSWTLNVLGQVTALTTPQGTFNYTYNTLGQPNTMTDVSGVWTTLYDSYHRAISSTNPWGETSSVVFDSYGRVNRKNIPNGMYETYIYDVRSRLTELKTYDSGNILRDTKTYVWDAASRITSATEGGVTATYGYDLIDQLTSEVKSALGYSASYTYDANGNRATRTVNGVTETYAYDGADKLTTITGGPRPRTFGYDLAGRTTSIVETAGTTTLSYDYEGKLTGVIYPDSSSDTFAYNGADARVSSSGVNGNKTFRRNGVGVLSPVMGDGSNLYSPGVSTRTGTITKYQHAGLKNTNDQSDSAQTVVASRHYDAFGNVQTSSGSWTGIFGYAGKYGYQEDENGLRLLGNRYYDSDTGRFLTQDPATSGSSWYIYSRNNPISKVDPAGLDEIYVGMQTGGSIVGATGTHLILGIQEGEKPIRWYGLRSDGIDSNDLPYDGIEYAFYRFKDIQPGVAKKLLQEIAADINKRKDIGSEKWNLLYNNCADWVLKKLASVGAYGGSDADHGALMTPKKAVTLLSGEGDTWEEAEIKPKRRPKPGGGGGGSSTSGAVSTEHIKPSNLQINYSMMTKWLTSKSNE